MVIQNNREQKILNNPSFQKRFYSKISIQDDCHIWIGATKSSGYGIITLGKRGEGTISANRAAFILYNNRIIKDNHIILHLCNNKLCCNPKHLLEGTHTDNITQAYDDNIRKCGQNHPFSTILDTDVIEIRRLFFEGNNLKNIYDLYPNISKGYISSIIKEKVRIRK